MAREVDDDEVLEYRRGTQGKALREYWRDPGWEPFQPEGFYVTWSGLLEYALQLLGCSLLGHAWYDCEYVLYGEPGGNRECQRCYRRESLRTQRGEDTDDA